jgi:hypothetical protein
MLRLSTKSRPVTAFTQRHDHIARSDSDTCVRAGTRVTYELAWLTGVFCPALL